MSPAAVIAIRRAHEAPLRQQGVRHAALFGSTARGEATPDSDVDIMVEIDPTGRVDLYAYVGIMRYIADLFPVSVDVADHAMLVRPFEHPPIETRSMPSDAMPTAKKQMACLAIPDKVSFSRDFPKGRPAVKALDPIARSLGSRRKSYPKQDA